MNDVRRAYCHARATRDVYVELPAKDPQYGVGDQIGKLKLCLYGTRDAAVNWQETLSQHLLDNGFVRGIGFRACSYTKSWTHGLWCMETIAVPPEVRMR